MAGLRVITRVVAFAKIGVLARLLTPAQFGTVGIASLVLAFLEITTDTGVNVFLIQGEGEVEDYLDTAWIVSIARGIAISLFILILSPFIVSFFRAPEARNLLYAMSLVPFFRGFINPAIVNFQKKLEFEKEFFLRFSTFLIDGVVAIAFALLTRSAMSLIWGMVAGVILEVAFSFIFIKHRPRLNFDFVKVKHVVHRGKWVTVYRLFEYLFKQGDDMVVGRLMNTDSLGIYQVGYKISSLPISEVADVFARVTFPVYSKISDNKDRIKKAYFKTSGLAFIIMLPMTAVFYLFPEQIVRILLGEQWLQAVPVLRVLSAFGLVRGMISPTNSLFLALKKQEYVSGISIVSTIILAVLIVPFVKNWGIIGAGYAALAGAICAWPVAIYYVRKTLS